jgi:hypothetical protein
MAAKRQNQLLTEQRALGKKHTFVCYAIPDASARVKWEDTDQENGRQQREGLMGSVAGKAVTSSTPWFMSIPLGCLRSDASDV